MNRATKNEQIQATRKVLAGLELKADKAKKAMQAAIDAYAQACVQQEFARAKLDQLSLSETEG
jgi:hypothetical protein